MTKGWRLESARHSLARRGVKTRTPKSFTEVSERSIPTKEKLHFFEEEHRKGVEQITQGFTEFRAARSKSKKLEALAKIKEGKARRIYASKQILHLAPQKYWKRS